MKTKLLCVIEIDDVSVPNARAKLDRFREKFTRRDTGMAIYEIPELVEMLARLSEHGTGMGADMDADLAALVDEIGHPTAPVVPRPPRASTRVM